MSLVGDATGGHGGTCGFCGTSVRPDFMTCTGCGATWKSLVNAGGRLMIKGSWIVGVSLAFLSVGVFKSFGAAMFVLVGVSLGMVVWGATIRTTAWYR